MKMAVFLQSSDAYMEGIFSNYKGEKHPPLESVVVDPPMNVQITHGHGSVTGFQEQIAFV